MRDRANHSRDLGKRAIGRRFRGRVLAAHSYSRHSLEKNDCFGSNPFPKIV